MITEYRVGMLIAAVKHCTDTATSDEMVDSLLRNAVAAYEQSKWRDIDKYKPYPRQIVMNSNNVLAYWEDSKWNGLEGFTIDEKAKYWQPLPTFIE